MKKRISLLSNTLFAAAILTGGYALIKSYVLTRNLPPGVCPIDNSRPLMYVAIGLSLGALAASFVSDKIEKKADNKDDL